MYLLLCVNICKCLECYFSATDVEGMRSLCLVFDKKENVRDVYFVKNRVDIEECKLFTRYSDDNNSISAFLSVTGFEYADNGQRVNSFVRYDRFKKDLVYTLYCFNRDSEPEKYESILVKIPSTDFETFIYIESDFLSERNHEAQMMDLVREMGRL